MVTLREGISNALRAFPCFALANGQYAYGAVARVFPLSPAGAISDGYQQLRRLLGCDPLGDEPPPPPPFTGGQCPGTLYNVNVTGTIVDPPTNTTFEANLVGPLRYINNAGSPGSGGCPGGLSFNSFEIRGSTETAIISWSGCGAALTVNSVIALSGPDDCGDPPPDYPPPTDIDIDIDVTYNIEEGDEVTVTIPFTFSPINVDLSGNFNIPFQFSLGGVNFSGTLEIAPNFNVNINPPTAPRGTGDGIDELPEGDPTEEVEPVPPAEKVIGVAVTSVLIGEQKLTTIATQNIPTIFAPRAGSIKFAYSLGVSTFWSDDIDIKGDRTFIPCPFSQGADFVAVSPAPGVEVQWRAITGYPLATVADVS